MLKIPMKKQVRFTKHLTIRVEKELKDDIDRLAEYGVDTQELMRESLRISVDKAKEQVEDLRGRATDAV